MKFTKQSITLIFSALILVFFSLFVHMSKIAYHNKVKAQSLEATISNENKKLNVSKIKLNDSLEVMQGNVEDLQITLQNLKSKYSKLLAASKVKPKYVDRITEVRTTTHSIDTIICKVDTFGGMTAHLDDGYANINVRIDSAKKAIIDYSVDDSITIINYTKRHSILFGLIKWKSYQGSKVITNNPKSEPKTFITYNILGK